MTNTNHRTETKKRKPGDLESTRNRNYNAVGKADGKARPQPSKQRAPLATDKDQVRIKEDLDHHHSLWRSAHTKYHQAMWAYVEAMTGYTKGDVVTLIVAGLDHKDWRIEDCLRKHNQNQYQLVLAPLRLIGRGKRAYHGALKTQSKKIPVEGFHKLKPEMSTTTILARPVDKAKAKPK